MCVFTVYFGTVSAFALKVVQKCYFTITFYWKERVLRAYFLRNQYGYTGVVFCIYTVHCDPVGYQLCIF
jgi:hypothetical protein